MTAYGVALLNESRAAAPELCRARQVAVMRASRPLRTDTPLDVRRARAEDPSLAGVFGHIDTPQRKKEDGATVHEWPIN